MKPPTLPHADTMSRVVKMALDTGEAETVEAGYDLFRSYRVGVAVGPEAADSSAHQAALLTIVNTARRALLGGITVTGHVDVPLRLALPYGGTLATAVQKLGGVVAKSLPADVPALTVGSAAAPADSPVSLAVTFEGWRAGVIPTEEGRRLREEKTVTTAAVLAGAFGVSEVFQNLRGNVMAANRSTGLSLWSPDSNDWENAPQGPYAPLLPSRLWLVGLGHLGQAYLWTLGLLPYRAPGDVELVLQDFDRLTDANDSTSVLTTPELVGAMKTRSTAAWAEARGFRTRIVERVFPGGMTVANDEPRLALGGVDNPQARAAYETAGFDRVVEAGLGAGPREYLAMRVHAFPASTTARAKWGTPAGAGEAPTTTPRAYEALARDGMDECGLVRLASRTVGAPFVGVATATLVVAEVLRSLNGGPTYEVIDMTLRDPASRAAVHCANPVAAWNPGYTW